MQLYCEQIQPVTRMIHAAKQSYYHSKIQDAEDQKDLFKVVNTLLHRSKNSALPIHTSARKLASKFCRFFADKIHQIRADLGGEDCQYIVLPGAKLKHHAGSLVRSDQLLRRRSGGCLVSLPRSLVN